MEVFSQRHDITRVLLTNNMYRRFLNNKDYLGLITPEALAQITRGDNERFIQAEESAEMSIVEYLSENYEIEGELNKGKYIAEYDRQICYPCRAHVYYQGKIHEVIKAIGGYKVPADVEYWDEIIDINIDAENLPRYSQFETYRTGDTVKYNDIGYICLHDNGYKFGDVRIPMVHGWIEAEAYVWQPIDYNQWEIVSFEGNFYTLLSSDYFDNNLTPVVSDNWAAIADYSKEYNEYELSEHEYVVYKDKVYYPEIDVNADIPVLGYNISPADPRNYNLKKHMARLAMYELSKLIAPNNVSVIRIKDYEDSIKWLNDASKLKINPQIPRKIGEDRKPVTDWQISTFQTEFDPYKNPWLT